MFFWAALAAPPAVTAAQTASNSGPWQPTQSAIRSEDYAGTAACVFCHRTQGEKQGTSQMGRSLLLPTEASPDHRQITLRRGAYLYTLRRDGSAGMNRIGTSDPFVHEKKNLLAARSDRFCVPLIMKAIGAPTLMSRATRREQTIWNAPTAS